MSQAINPMMSQTMNPGTGASGAGRLGAAFFRHAAAAPAKQALWCEGRGVSYGELAQLVRLWSWSLAAGGVRRGDLIGVILPNSIEFVALILVAADLGAALVPLSTGLTPVAVERAFEAAQVTHLVSNAQLMAPLLARPGLDRVGGLWLSVDEALPGIAALPALLRAAPADAAAQSAGRDDDALILTMTSGSTGDPKPIVLTQRTKFNRVHAAIELYGVLAQDRTLAATPLYHSLAERLVLIPLLTGGTSVLMAHFSARAWLDCVAAQAISFTIAVSSQLKQIAAELGHGHDTSSLRCLVSSSALLEDALKTELLGKFKCEVHECYGASEIAIATNLDGVAAQSKLASVGRPAPGVDIAILGPGDTVLGPEQAGEIVCKTGMLFGGYFQRPQLTEASMWGDYFRTGDLGRLDVDGFLYFLGRKKDLIISGGINIYPSDIEAALTSHGSLKEGAAFAFPDARLGEVVAVALVPHDPATFDLRALRFHCADVLADFQQPRKFFIVEELPRNAMGKLMKFQLVKTYASNTTQG